MIGGVTHVIENMPKEIETGLGLFPWIHAFLASSGIYLYCLCCGGSYAGAALPDRGID